MWGIAKDFAVDEELFDKLVKTYDVKQAIKILSKKCDEKVVRIVSIFFLICPKLCVKILYCYKKGN